MENFRYFWSLGNGFVNFSLYLRVQLYHFICLEMIHKLNELFSGYYHAYGCTGSSIDTNIWNECQFIVIWQAWTEASSIPNALVCMLLKLPKVKFVIVTLGEDGCLMLERCLGGKYYVDTPQLLFPYVRYLCSWLLSWEIFGLEVMVQILLTLHLKQCFKAWTRCLHMK